MSNDNNAIHLAGVFSGGYGLIPKNIMRARDLGLYDKLVLAYMLSYTGAGKTECFPSYRTMESDLQISRPTLAKALKNLEERGYIKKSRLYPDDPLRHNNKYTIQFLDPPIVNHVNKRGKRSELSRLTTLTSNNNSFNNKREMYQPLEKI